MMMVMTVDADFWLYQRFLTLFRLLLCLGSHDLRLIEFTRIRLNLYGKVAGNNEVNWKYAGKKTNSRGKIIIIKACWVSRWNRVKFAYLIGRFVYYMYVPCQSCQHIVAHTYRHTWETSKVISSSRSRSSSTNTNTSTRSQMNDIH